MKKPPAILLMGPTASGKTAVAIGLAKRLPVELISVDTGAPEGDDEVAGKPWFNTKIFPTAKFVSSSVKALGGNKYEVSGQLSIKGRTQGIIVPATFTTQGKTGVFDGSFTIRRADFSIGEFCREAIFSAVLLCRPERSIRAQSGVFPTDRH